MTPMPDSDIIEDVGRHIGHMASATIGYSFGLWGLPKMTGNELSEMFGISYQKVSALKRIGLLLLRSELSSPERV